MVTADRGLAEAIAPNESTGNSTLRACRLSTLREPRRTIRIARALWLCWAVVLWNVVFDHVIVVAGRKYLVAAGAAVGTPGPYPRMDDWMRPAVTMAYWTASGAALGVLVTGCVLIGVAARARSARRN